MSLVRSQADPPAVLDIVQKIAYKSGTMRSNEGEPPEITTASVKPQDEVLPQLPPQIAAMVPLPMTTPFPLPSLPEGEDILPLPTGRQEVETVARASTPGDSLVPESITTVSITRRPINTVRPRRHP